MIGFFGVMAPAATPREIVARLNGDLAKAMSRPDVREKFAAQALDPGKLTAGEFADFITNQAERFGKLIKEAGISAR
ncbi:Tripartite tricarboxylate transporter family receptor [compost metagenome]